MSVTSTVARDLAKAIVRESLIQQRNMIDDLERMIKSHRNVIKAQRDEAATNLYNARLFGLKMEVLYTCVGLLLWFPLVPLFLGLIVRAYLIIDSPKEAANIFNYCLGPYPNNSFIMQYMWTFYSFIPFHCPK